MRFATVFPSWVSSLCYAVMVDLPRYRGKRQRYRHEPWIICHIGSSAYMLQLKCAVCSICRARFSPSPPSPPLSRHIFPFRAVLVFVKNAVQDQAPHDRDRIPASCCKLLSSLARSTATGPGVAVRDTCMSFEVRVSSRELPCFAFHKLEPRV